LFYGIRRKEYLEKQSKKENIFTERAVHFCIFHPYPAIFSFGDISEKKTPWLLNLLHRNKQSSYEGFPSIL
jgi:hypothetical protein